MRPDSTCKTPGDRSNALWGKGTRGNEARGNALWGKAGRGFVTLAILASALALPMAGVAGNGNNNNNNDNSSSKAAAPFVSSKLLAAAQANPRQIFKVIVQGAPSNKHRGTRGYNTSQVATDVGTQISGDSNNKGGGKSRLGKKFSSIAAVSADLSGWELVRLAKNPQIAAITWDAPMKATGEVIPDSSMWLASTHVDALSTIFDPWTGLSLGAAPNAPTIAIIDSGIDKSKVADFGTRVVASVNFSSLDPMALGDDEGHGTMVAGLAAGASAAFPGAAPTAKLIDLRTANGDGESVTSDVIAATDWILAHKDQYNIKVANFSMASASTVSFRFDPLDQAVERLWFAGITVVAASGNHGTGTGTVDMSHSPGNDPFVVTVGALDQQGTADPGDDTVPWWSAYGNTLDGFSKPDIAAPGRYMVGPVPVNSTLAKTAPERIVAPGYMWMSGTSFAAPIVSGAVAGILAQHPDWGPDEVKGALMLSAAYLPSADPQAAGVGEVDAGTAASFDFTPPNPNENLTSYVTTDPATGARVFDQAAWSSAVQSVAAWSSAAWSSAAWSSAAWNSAAWSSAAWNSASFSADVNSAMQSMASWNS